MQRVPTPVACAPDSLPDPPKSPHIEDLLLPTGMFCAGLLGSVMTMILLWASPSMLQTVANNAAATIVVR